MLIRARPSGHQYKVVVCGAGEPLALLHGFTGDSSTWQELIAAFSGDFRVIRLDILGHGKSDKPASTSSYEMSAVAADFIDVLNQLGILQTHLLGYSMGGRLALYLALFFADRLLSLALESASPGLADEGARAERRRRDEALADRIEAQGMNWFVAYWEKLPLWAAQSRRLIAAQRSQRLANNPLGLANSLRGMGTGAQPNLWAALPTLALPTCLITGERDVKFRRINQRMDAAMPQSRLSIIPAAGHNAHLEQPAAFHRALRSFLNGA